MTMDTEMVQFQQTLQSEVVRVQSLHQIPRRLLLGRHDYAILERFKRLYPNFPNSIVVEGREHRFGFEIVQTDAERYFEIQGEAG